MFKSASYSKTSSSLLESPLSDSRKHYKNRIVEQWDAFKPKKVRVSLYRNTKEVLRLIFNGIGSDKINWFAFERVLSSPWTDLASQPKNYFTIAGHVTPAVARTFFINSMYTGCENDRGWMMLSEKPACDYEKRMVQFSIFYSPGPTRVRYFNSDSKNVADMMAIYVL
ncbi:hypothetical protein QZH41_018599 [Actinostola sp. cb2023]|nr:hypothetical protein QZH41_018599 [Actinostola sp. cb2023]